MKESVSLAVCELDEFCILTEFGSIENPFVEENDTGTEGDPDTVKGQELESG